MVHDDITNRDREVNELLSGTASTGSGRVLNTGNPASDPPDIHYHYTTASAGLLIDMHYATK